MIAFLEGTVFARDSESLVLKTSGGVGYRVFVTQGLLVRQANKAELFLHIFTYVREGEITLFGFDSEDERFLFEQLIKTSGVGPKLALAVLSTLSPHKLVEAIEFQDIAQLNAVPGVGKKTAAKLCLDLKDRLSKYPWQSTSPTVPPGESRSPVRADLISALSNMGFLEKDVYRVVREVINDSDEFEELFKQALKLLSSK